MPRYHFHCADGSRQYDPEGTVLASDETARQEAIKFAGSVLKDDPDGIWQAGQWRVEVTDDDDALLFTVITLVVDAPKPAASRRS